MKFLVYLENVSANIRAFFNEQSERSVHLQFEDCSNENSNLQSTGKRNGSMIVATLESINFIKNCDNTVNVP